MEDGRDCRGRISCDVRGNGAISVTYEEMEQGLQLHDVTVTLKLNLNP
jgi:hypothetical protein